MKLSTVLNRFPDPQKRAAYDSSGGDPDSRFSGMSSRGFSSAGPQFAGNGFGEEISPEDLFNMFFGGGGGGGRGLGERRGDGFGFCFLYFGSIDGYEDSGLGRP